MSELISVVIPCRNEVRYIKQCVEAIYKSNYAPIEVIVVDGMSDDGTRDILESLKRTYTSLKVVNNVKKLTPYAFNLGVKEAQGEYVQIVGSRNLLHEDYLSLLKFQLENHKDIACVGGDYQHTYDTDTGRYIALAMESSFGVGGSNYRVKKADCLVDTVGVPMYRKGIFEEIGYFDEDLTRNQDDDYNFRVTQAGYKIKYVAQAEVKYFVRGDWKKLFKQYSQYGYFKVYVNKKHKTVTTIRQLVPLAFVLFLIIFGIGGFFNDQLFNGYILGLLLYVVVGLAFTYSSNVDKKTMAGIFFSCFIIHVGYGLGYLRGLIDFLILNKRPGESMQKQTT